jgi:hypothetical protein
MPKFTGGCLCGAVRYEADGDPAMVAVCHCATCQKNTGSSYSINLGMPADAVTITGDGKAVYEDRTGASGKPFHRTFCARCGSPIAGHGDAYPGIVFLKGGTLDDPSVVTPSVHIWCVEKQPWVVIEEGVRQVARSPV